MVPASQTSWDFYYNLGVIPTAPYDDLLGASLQELFSSVETALVPVRGAQCSAQCPVSPS